MVKLDRMAGELDSAMVDMSSEREDLVQIPGTVPEMDTMLVLFKTIFDF